MSDDTFLWGISHSTRLNWARHEGEPSLVFHSGSGQTVALDPLGEAVLSALQDTPQTQFELHQKLFEQALLTRSEQDARRLFGVLRALFDAALIDRQWPGAFAD